MSNLQPFEYPAGKVVFSKKPHPVFVTEILCNHGTESDELKDFASGFGLSVIFTPLTKEQQIKREMVVGIEPPDIEVFMNEDKDEVCCYINTDLFDYNYTEDEIHGPIPTANIITCFLKCKEIFRNIRENLLPNCMSPEVYHQKCNGIFIDNRDDVLSREAIKNYIDAMSAAFRSVSKKYVKEDSDEREFYDEVPGIYIFTNKETYDQRNGCCQCHTINHALFDGKSFAEYFEPEPKPKKGKKKSKKAKNKKKKK